MIKHSVSTQLAMSFKMIVAFQESDYGIGLNNTIPWNLTEDKKFFSKTTKNSVIIMGRKTYESIGRPLPNRINIVITSNKYYEIKHSTIIVCTSVEDAIRHCFKNYPELDKYVIGGEQIYSKFFKGGWVSELYATVTKTTYKCDKFFDPNIMKEIVRNNKYAEELGFSKKLTTPQLLVKDENMVILKFNYLNIYEKKMLNDMKEILKEEKRLSRNASVRSTYFKMYRFNLEDNLFPLMTTRPMFLRGVFEELMLYLRGQTDNQILVDKGVNVWTANTTREKLDELKLNHLPVGDMGHSYGFSFRHFGGKYVDCKTDYTGVGFDQLNWLINEINTNPYSRRLIISLWEPNIVSALPPCLEQYLFYVEEVREMSETSETSNIVSETSNIVSKENVNESNKTSKVVSYLLNCTAVQRSSDIFVAGGWNIATCSLFMKLLCEVCKPLGKNMTPGSLCWIANDVHIYENNEEGTKEQIERYPNNYPHLFIKNSNKKIEEFEFEDLELIDYHPQSKIKTYMNA